MFISAHARGVFSNGASPPPDRIEPTCASARTAFRHESTNGPLTLLQSPRSFPTRIWAICPIFSSSVILRSRSSTRRSDDARASR
ncbi:hypothetical protein BBK82_04280 [Lentzea guizhouensis]|uniref:Uncharacterized protein n=1 Tax=Lentzea guizhouensis TaxID=1586287 RepID=A0A1B2HCG3_9PSEU|nr:hypothetical protein BBK82_04280 [Lentzea guizhouensis]